MARHRADRQGPQPPRRSMAPARALTVEVLVKALVVLDLLAELLDVVVRLLS